MWKASSISSAYTNLDRVHAQVASNQKCSRRVNAVPAKQQVSAHIRPQLSRNMEAQDPKRTEENKKAAEEQREVMLAQLLTPQARERLNRIALVKADKARSLENALLQAAMQGRLGGKVSEEQLIKMLEQQPASEPAGLKIIRRKGFDDDEDDLSDFR